VFTSDFQQALDFLERLGQVQSKEVREGTTPVDEKTARAKEPDARIDMSFREVESSKIKLTVAIAAPLGGIALTVLLGFLYYLAYSAGRRRAPAP
jgi:hypothetical protein